MTPVPSRSCVLVCAAMLAGCGYVGDPLPPALNIPSPVTDLRVKQAGASLVFEFTIPALTTEGLVLERIGEVSLKGAGWAGEFREAAWEQRARRIEVEASAPGPARVETLATGWVGTEALFAVRLANTKGRWSELSNRVSITPGPPLGVPSPPRAEPVPGGVRLAWQPLPDRQGLTYRVYRQADADQEPVVAAEVGGAEWTDEAAEFGKRYRYAVQVLGRAGAAPAESEVSPFVEITPVDRFPPAAPSGLLAVAGVRTIELSWERNPEPDLEGYYLYRGLAGESLQRLGPRITGLNFSDAAIEPGRRYRYALSAVDTLGNEGEQSAPVEIEAP